MVPDHHEVIDSKPGHALYESIAHGVLAGPVKVMHKKTEKYNASLAGFPDWPDLWDVGNMRRQPIKLDGGAGTAERGQNGTHAVREGKLERRDVAETELLEHDGRMRGCLNGLVENQKECGG